MFEFAVFISIAAVLICAFSIAYIYYMVRKYYLQRNRDDSSDIRVGLTSSMSSEGFGFLPPLPPYNLPTGLLEDVAEIDYRMRDGQPLDLSKVNESKKKSSKNEQESSGDTYTRVIDVESPSGTDIPPRLIHRQASLEKLWSSLDKSTLSLQWNNENDFQHEPDKIEVGRFLAPNTTPEGGKASKLDTGIFGVSLKSALAKLQEENDDKRNAPLNNVGCEVERVTTPNRGNSELLSNLMICETLGLNTNTSSLSVYKSTSSLPSVYNDAYSYFESGSSNSS